MTKWTWQRRDAKHWSLTPSKLAKRNATALLRNAIGAHRIGERTFVIRISISSLDPTRAAELANAVADQYLISQLQEEYQAVERANSWLGDRIGGLREKLQSSERAVAEFSAEFGLVDASGATLNERQILNLIDRLGRLRAEQAEKEARLEIARTQLAQGGGQFGLVPSPVIAELRRERSDLLLREVALLANGADSNIELGNVRRGLAEVEVAIAAETEAAVSGVEADLEIVRQQVAFLESRLEEERSTLIENNSAMVTLRELERESETDRALYESFLERFKQIGEFTGLQSANARIISRASIPTSPSAPNWMLNAILAILAATGVGVLTILAAEYLDTSLNSPEDVERHLDEPVLASIPRIGKSTEPTAYPPDFLVENPLSRYAEAFRALRSSVLLANIDKHAQIVAITSAIPGEGKTVTAHSLARISAMLGAKTLLIDGDLRRRQLTINLGLDNKNGLLEILAENLPAELAIHKDTKTDLSVLPASRHSSIVGDVFGSIRMRELLEQLRADYDLIILDTAPLNIVTEARTAAYLVDATVLVALWRKTNYRAARTARNILISAHASIVGVVLSQVGERLHRRYGGAPYYDGSDTSYYTN